MSRNFMVVRSGKNIYAPVIVVLSCLALAACGGGAAPPTFDLTAPTGPVRGSGGGQIVVQDPSALLIYDGDRIVVRQGGQV
ncbi:MAG: ABC-type transport auxiliary lipoprotein family protein, partial [Beijerinckiaceae bacterium]